MLLHCCNARLFSLYLYQKAISTRFTLGKHERLKSRKLLEELFRQGRSFFVHPVKVYYQFLPEAETLQVSTQLTKGIPPAPEKKTAQSHAHTTRPLPAGGVLSPLQKNIAPLQAAFGVSSRTFKKAVDRNRIKRLLREAYRLQKPELAAATGNNKKLAVFFLYVGKELPEFGMVKEKMEVVLRRLMKELQ